MDFFISRPEFAWRFMSNIVQHIPPRNFSKTTHPPNHNYSARYIIWEIFSKLKTAGKINFVVKFLNVSHFPPPKQPVLASPPASGLGGAVRPPPARGPATPPAVRALSSMTFWRWCSTQAPWPPPPLVVVAQGGGGAGVCAITSDKCKPQIPQRTRITSNMRSGLA